MEVEEGVVEVGVEVVEEVGDVEEDVEVVEVDPGSTNICTTVLVKPKST